MKKTTLASLVGLLFAVPTYANEAVNTDDVIVTASRIPQSRENVVADVSVITAEDIERAGQSSLVELLQLQPGIEISSNGGLGKTASVRIRGASDNQTVILVDGLRMNSATLGTTAIQHIPLDQVERIEIMRGPASSLYGSEAIGGVIQIFTKRSEGSPKFNFSIGAGAYNTQDTSAGVSGRVNDTSFGLQAGYLHSDGFSALNSKNTSNYNPDADGYQNRNVSAHLAQHIDEKNEIGINLFHTEGLNHYDGSFFDTATFTSKFQDYDFREKQKISGYSVYSSNQFTSAWLSTLKIGRGIDDLTTYDPNSTNTGTVQSRFKTTQNQYSWQNNFSLPLGKLNLELERLEQDVSGTTAYAVKSRNINSAMAEWLANIGAHDFQLNVRTDKSSQFGRHNTWFAGYGYQLIPNWRATLSYGTAFNAPTFNQLYYPLDSFGSVGNPNLVPEESKNVEAGLHYKNNSRQANLTVYQNKVDNLIDWSFDPITFAATPKNIHKATLRGINVNWTEMISDWRISANADIQSPKDAETDKLLERRAQRHGTFAIDRYFGKWMIGAEVFGESWRFDSNSSDTKLNGYALLNLTTSYAISDEWTINGRVNNALNKDYELAYGFNTPSANLFVGLRWQPK